MTTRDGLRFVRGRGLSIADARELRVFVRDDQLYVRRPGGAAAPVGGALDATAALWLSPAQAARLLEPRRWSRLLSFWAEPLARAAMRRRTGSAGRWAAETPGGAVLITAETRVMLAFPVRSFVPWGGADDRALREASGAVDLVRSIGLVLEAAADADLPSRRAARAALVDAQPDEPMQSGVCLALTVLAGVLAFLSWPTGGTRTGVLLNVAAVVAISPVLALLVRQRRRFASLLESPPDPGERTVYRPPATSIGDLHTHLQLGRDDVVLVDAGGYERWLPGPSAGGVTSCVFADEEIVWMDDQGRELLVLPADDVAPDQPSRQRLADACASAGITVSTDLLRTPVAPSYSLRHRTIEPGFWMSEWERGRISMAVDVLVPLAAVLHLVGALAVAYSFPPWGLLAPAGSAAWLGIRIWSGLRYRSWRRGVLRAEQR